MSSLFIQVNLNKFDTEDCSFDAEAVGALLHKFADDFVEFQLHKRDGGYISDPRDKDLSLVQSTSNRMVGCWSIAEDPKNQRLRFWA